MRQHVVQQWQGNIDLALLHQMKRIRQIELAIATRYSEGKMRCPTHLSVGQEGVAAAAGTALTFNDLAISTHRGHAHYLAKGGDSSRMIAEIYGKEGGCSRGFGGSMHLLDLEIGFMGSTAIVGNSIPVGVGLALAIKHQQLSKVSCIFLGDGAVEEGAFYEAANFAALKRLPVLFICENNLYSVYSPLSVRQPETRKIHQLAASIGMTSASYDGNDVKACFEGISHHLDSIREGIGPCFLEFSTYRWLEHCGPHYDNHIGYRSEDEFLRWQALEPIARFERQLLKNSMITPPEIALIDSLVTKEVSAAFTFAEESAFPRPEICSAYIYK